MYTGDITWQAGSSTIYINSNYLSTYGLQYLIVNSRDATTQITTSTLTILSVSSATTITYTCSCNIYSSVTGCSIATTGWATVSGYTNATTVASITSTATPSTSMSTFSSLSNFSQLKIGIKKKFKYPILKFLWRLA